MTNKLKFLYNIYIYITETFDFLLVSPELATSLSFFLKNYFILKLVSLFFPFFFLYFTNVIIYDKVQTIRAYQLTYIVFLFRKI